MKNDKRKKDNARGSVHMGASRIVAFVLAALMLFGGLFSLLYYIIML